MGTRSKRLLKGGRRKPEFDRAVPHYREPDHAKDQREALAYVGVDPECTVEDVAKFKFDGCRAIAFAVLNALRNQGVLVRENDKYTVSEEFE